MERPTEGHGKKGATLEDAPIDHARVAWSKTWHFRAFVATASAFTIAEAILVAWTGTPGVLYAQIAILACSTVLFFVGAAATYAYMPDFRDEQPLDTMEKIRRVFDMEVFIEAFCLILGWSCITHAPGVAALRILRVFRLMWYMELFKVKLPPGEDHSEHRFNLVKASSLCLLYLERLVDEFFTAASKGGLVVLLMFFFLAYVFALVFWIQLPNLETAEGHTCQKLSSCVIIMLRLSFYDGTGFDYLTALVVHNKHGYAALLILYTVLTAIVLLNGLIGIFGQAFSHEEEEEDDGEVEAESITKLDSCLAVLTNLQQEVRRMQQQFQQK